MKVTFVSNYINHHQIPVSDVLYRKLGDDYRFVETEPMARERVNMGWNSDTSKIPYVLRYFEKEELCRGLIADSDIVIFGGVDDEKYITDRIKSGKTVIRYSERLYKEGQWKAVSPRGLLKKYKDHTSNNKRDVYLLCSGAYVADDFNIVKAYPGKRFKWGYFPEFIENDGKKEKEDDCVNILWAGRFLDWKNPFTPIDVARKLKEENVNFRITMVGDGECREDVEEEVAEEGLKDYFDFPGSMSPNEVRVRMMEADIYLFTSNYYEGWGAVLNEAMNSRCAVIASYAAGATPFLMKHGYNGFIYKESSSNSEIAEYALKLCRDAGLRRKFGDNAYETIAKTWNPENAANCLYEFMVNLTEGKVTFQKEGPMSEAKVIRQRKMYKYLMENADGCQN